MVELGLIWWTGIFESSLESYAEILFQFLIAKYNCKPSICIQKPFNIILFVIPLVSLECYVFMFL